jgi:hypothetical protein
MNSFKLFAFTVVGAGALVFGSVSTTACSNSTDAGTAGTAGGAGSGDAGAAGGEAAGAAGAAAGAGGAAAGAGGGTAAGAGGAAAGAGGGTAAGKSGQELADALGITGDACTKCIDGMTGAAGMIEDCSKVVAACDTDTAATDSCADYIGGIKQVREGMAMAKADCWVEGAATQVPSGKGNELLTCVSKLCGTQCGNLTEGNVCN